MPRKYKFYLFFLFFIIILSWVMLNVGVKKGPITQKLKSFIPEKAKTILKKSIFSIPMLNQTTELHTSKIKKLEKLVAMLKSDVAYIGAGNQPVLPLTGSININSTVGTYQLNTYHLPFPDVERWLGKPAAYIEQTENKIILASGLGQFFYINKEEIKISSEKSEGKTNETTDTNLKIPVRDRIQLTAIASNIKDLIEYEKFYLPGTYSIKDLLVINNKIFVSFTNEQSDNCFNTSIIVAEIKLNFLKFSNFFPHKECNSLGTDKTTNPQHGGGRMFLFKNEKILLTIGDYGTRSKAQNEKSIFGKIISIDLASKDYEIIAMGSRNAQGLYYDEEADVILHTEHGPKGGDEININLHPNSETVKNFGWPHAFYGTLSDGTKLPNSHKDFGFVEPIKYFTPGIGISEIIKIPRFINPQFTNDFLVAAMGWSGELNDGDRSLHHLRFNKNFDQIIFENVIPIDERIRDMIFVKDSNLLLLILESMPALGIIKF